MHKLPHRLASFCLRTLLFVLVWGCPADVFAGLFRRDPPRPGKTSMDEPFVVLPAQIISHYIIVTAKWDRRGPYNFLIDTGGSVSLVSPTLAKRYGVPVRDSLTGKNQGVTVRSASGETAVLDSISLKRLELGEVVFESVPALVYDCSELSVHLGIRIDGILGFPMFREVLLTLDYPHSRVVMARLNSASALLPGSTLPISSESKAPIISLKTGNQSFIALLDTGSDCTLRLNPLGLGLPYAQSPRPGAIVTTLTGDRRQTLARLDTDLHLGDYVLSKPDVELTDELSAVGGAVLSQFSVTFDQEHNTVTFYRPDHTPLGFPPRRSSGISVSKAGAYWRIVGVIPDSPAAKAGVETGDLITRINDEPVEFWNTERYNTLIASSDTVSFAFLVGKREYEMKLSVMELVP